MSDYYSKAPPIRGRVTLNSLKEQLYSLNMRLLLAMQYHNEPAQENIKKEMAEVQADIDRMLLGRGYQKHR